MSWLAVSIHAAFVAFCSVLRQYCGHWDLEAVLIVVLPRACIVITLLWFGVVVLADCGSWHFVPPPPNPNCRVYFYLLLFFIY